jgi:flagellar hook-associated protein 1 FlgK
MGLSTALEIGKTGLTIYRVATEVTSQNIANVNTPGYSRQRIIMESAPPTTSNGFPLGSGVRIASIERYYDGLLQKQLVNAQTTQGYDTTKSNVLQQIEPTFNEIANDGLGTAIADFFGAWQDLSLNPAGSTERQTVITRSQLLVDNFHSVSRALTDAATTQDQSLVPLVNDMNATLQSIAKLNGQIRYTEQSSGNANEMRDQRDQLVRDLSKQTGITFTDNSDGTTDVVFKDTGAALVTGSQYGSFSLTVNAGKYDVNLTPVGGVSAVVTPTTGSLGATVSLRDSIIPGYLAQVNSLATTIASTVNAQHQLGFDLNGNAGIAIFSPATSAATIAINPALTSTAQIAASGSATLPGGNSNALLLAQIKGTNTMSAGTTTFNSYYNSLVSKIGLDVQSGKNTVAQDEAFIKQLAALRESSSGVSLDEELANLIKYQRSYQASAKLISTASDMMDVALNMVR